MEIDQQASDLVRIVHEVQHDYALLIPKYDIDVARCKVYHLLTNDIHYIKESENLMFRSYTENVFRQYLPSINKKKEKLV